MKRLKDEWAAWGKWPGSAIVMVGLCIALVPTMLAAPVDQPSFTAWEQNVATRCKVYFGPRPFSYYVFSRGELNALRSQEYLARVKAAHVGTIIVFKQLMQGSNQPSGVLPIDGHWEWKDSAYMAGIIEFLHDEGFKVVAYMSPHTWEAADLPAVDMVDEVARLGVDGGYFDGWTIGDRPEAAADVLGRMNARGYVIWLHGSSGPYAANWTAKRRQSYLMPGGELATHYLYGEIQILPDDPTERIQWLKSRVAMLDRAPGTITYYTPCEWCPGAPRIHRSLLPQYLVATCVSRKHLKAMQADFVPEYQRLALEYHQNREAFVRRVAREW